MTKFARLLAGVTKLPAVGLACPVQIWDVTKKSYKNYWLGHIWTGDREGKYLRPRETVQEANLDAINAVIALGRAAK